MPEPRIGCPPMASPDHLLRHPADRPQAPRQLHRRDPPVRRGPGPRRPGDLLHRRPARDLGRLRPGRAARAALRHHRDPARRRPRPRALHPLPPVRRARAHRADLAALRGHRPRRPQPHAPVQGQVGAPAGAGLGRALLLPGADGRRRARLPRHRGPGRRRPAPARRADAGDRPPLQRALRRDPGRAGAARSPRSAPGSWTCRSRSGRCRPPAAPRPAPCSSSTSPRRSARSSAAPSPTPAARSAAARTSPGSPT